MATKRIVLHEIDPATAQREIENFVVRKILEAGARGGVVGLSGGIDSSSVAFLAASAFRRHAQEKPAAPKLELTGLTLTATSNSPAELEDAAEVARRLGIRHIVFSIQPLIDEFVEQIPDALPTPYHRGNLASEIRAVVLSRHAAALNALVLGTGNRDEDYCLGYFTKRGDGAVDISPIGALSKRNVRIIAAHLGVPQRIIDKPPTAGLWAGQTDEGELGFSYDFAESVIAGIDQGLTAAETAKQLKRSVADVKKVLDMNARNGHKLRMPDIAPVTFLKRATIEKVRPKKR
jgi:NAD+ synthase